MSEVKSFNQWMVDQGFNAIRHANCCRIAYGGGQQSMQAEIDRLNSVLDERTKEWLQAIKCGTYFENVAKPLKAENDALQKRVDEVCDLLDRAEVNHKHLLTKYQSTKAMEMSSSKMLSRVDQILNDLNESMKDFKEMDLYDKGYRVAFEYVIADLEKALRGEHE